MRHADGDWRSRGACSSADPELFFPMSSVGPSAEQLNRAKMVCTRCPVRAECLEFALATHQVHGVWGGTSEDERRRILARGRAAGQPARTRLKAGTRSGIPVVRASRAEVPGQPR
jgi:WhiB family transcriptional regulator, redox-sensing transcriptional regulator